LREDKTLALVLISIVLACGGAGMYPSASETLTVWRTITSKTTYTSTSMSLRASYVVTTSIETSTHTRLEDST